MTITSTIEQKRRYNNFMNMILHKILSIIFKLKITLLLLGVLTKPKFRLLAIFNNNNKAFFITPLPRVASAESVH